MSVGWSDGNTFAISAFSVFLEFCERFSHHRSCPVACYRCCRVYGTPHRPCPPHYHPCPTARNWCCHLYGLVDIHVTWTVTYCDKHLPQHLPPSPPASLIYIDIHDFKNFINMNCCIVLHGKLFMFPNSQPPASSEMLLSVRHPSGRRQEIQPPTLL